MSLLMHVRTLYMYIYVHSSLQIQKYISQSNTCAADDHVVQEYVNLAKVSVTHVLQLISNSAVYNVYVHMYMYVVCVRLHVHV